MYEMLLGQSPFRGDDEDEIFDAILEDEPLYPITMPRDAVAILQKVISHLLHYLDKNHVADLDFFSCSLATQIAALAQQKLMQRKLRSSPSSRMSVGMMSSTSAYHLPTALQSYVSFLTKRMLRLMLYIVERKRRYE